MSEKLTDQWETPDYLFQELNTKYGPFNLDAAASHHNHKINTYFTNETDSLLQSWSLAPGCPTIAWLNCPYSDPYPWMQKASQEASRGVKTICLLKADHTTKWYKDFIFDFSTMQPYPNVEIIPLPKRVKFKAPPGLVSKKTGLPVKETTSAFPSIVVIFHPKSC